MGFARSWCLVVVEVPANFEEDRWETMRAGI
jgi:hypothetical protein